ncbi:MAG TPA: 4Fe-4S dicluster domain-containing protein [Firmicutes bacterium]|nr:4Fe-4S dicluster domain-containing protein [Bacillota bacterium]
MKEITRRSFLKLGGVCALGLLAAPVLNAFGKGSLLKVTSDPAAKSAQRWAMVVDMQKCWAGGGETCRECIVACHREHNVPDIPDQKDAVKWIWKEPYENAFPGQGNAYTEEGIRGKPFLVLCNHCSNAPCVRVCPTKATFKREDGVVMMDYHRCIGCRYCMAACPYGARSFNFRDPRPYIQHENQAFPTREKGVVEKCHLCVERLAVGLPPACVQACPHGALVFGDLEDPDSDVRKILRTRYTIRRKPELGTEPNVYYVI